MPDCQDERFRGLHSGSGSAGATARSNLIRTWFGPGCFELRMRGNGSAEGWVENKNYDATFSADEETITVTPFRESVEPIVWHFRLTRKAAINLSFALKLIKMPCQQW